MVPKVTNPPFVLKSSNGSPLSSGGGIGAQQHGGTLAHFFELPTSVEQSPQHLKKLPLPSPYCNVKAHMIASLLGTVAGLILTSRHAADLTLKTEHGIPQTQIHASDDQSQLVYQHGTIGAGSSSAMGRLSQNMP